MTKDMLIAALNNPLRVRYNLNVLFGEIDKNPNAQGYNQWCRQDKHQTDNDIKNLFNIHPDTYKNYGFATGHEGLADFDFDWIWVYNRAREHFKERLDTFIVMTPNGGARVLIFTDPILNPEKYKESLKTEVHFKKYVVCYGEALKEDGSTGQYDIVNDSDIKTDNILASDLTKFLSDLLERYRFLKYPCIKSKLLHKKNHLNHEQRLDISNLLLHLGIQIPEAAEFFSTCPDYNKQYSEEQMQSTSKRIQEGTLNHPTCDTLRANFGWNEENCKNCPRKKEIGASKPVHISYAPTDLGNVHRLVGIHGSDIRYCHPWKKWFVWDGKRWNCDDTAAVIRKAKSTIPEMYREIAEKAKELLDEDIEKNDPEIRKINNKIRREIGEMVAHARNSQSNHSIKAMTELASSEEGIPILPEHMDIDPWRLNVLNGTIDLRTGELCEHRREEYHTKIVNVVYDPSAKCPLWDKFLDRIMKGNQKMIKFMQKTAGYSLTGSTREQCIFIFWGTGKNGKTTYISVIDEIAGDYGQHAHVDTILVKERSGGIPNDIARLKGARIVSAVEPDAGKQLAEGLAKAIGGCDKLTGRFLHGELFDFMPELKFFLITNHKPIIRGTDEGIWRKIRLVPFTVRIPDEEVDKDLPEKVKAELPGILNWAVQGCLEWQMEGLEMPEEVRQATEEYREDMDVLGDFLRICCELDVKAVFPNQEFYDAYRIWCTADKVNPMSQRAFTARLEEREFTKKKTKKGRIWFGLRLNQKVTEILTAYYTHRKDDEKEGFDLACRMMTDYRTVSQMSSESESTPEKTAHPSSESANPSPDNPSLGPVTLASGDAKQECEVTDGDFTAAFSNCSSRVHQNNYKNPSPSVTRHLDNGNIPRKSDNFNGNNDVFRTLTEKIARAAREWEQLMGTTGNSINLLEFCNWYCEHKDNTRLPSEIKVFAEKIFKITPAKGSNNGSQSERQYTQAVPKEVQIPFTSWSLERLAKGIKIATSRNKKYGDVGDYFKADNRTYILTAITGKTLKEVAEQYYKAEGAESPDEFIKIWNSIHRKNGFVPEQVVLYHEFKLNKGNKPYISELCQRGQHQEHRDKNTGYDTGCGGYCCDCICHKGD